MYTEDERLVWSVDSPDGRVACYDRQLRLQKEPLIIYPDHIFRRYQDETVIEELVLPIPMRCYCPDELLALVESHGFQVEGKWGGYNGECYGEGKDLVVEFTTA